MENHLGNIVYWSACGVAVLLIALGLSSLLGDGGLGLFTGPLILVFATASWQLGRRVKSILG